MILLKRVRVKTIVVSSINSLGKTGQPMKLINIKNNYYLVKFRSKDNYNRVLVEGSWIVYGQYLTVEPLLSSLLVSQQLLLQVVAWIRLPRLTITLYKQSLLKSQW